MTVPIAHRGHWWPDRAHQNQLVALQAAVAAGFGVELDVRLWFGDQLMLRHEETDRPWLLDGGRSHALVDVLHAAPVILWDIKELRVLKPLCRWLRTHALVRSARLFDLELAATVREPGTFSSPRWDMLCAAVWAEFQVPYLLRASETESLFDALGDPHAAGVWLDAWDREWVDETTIQTVQAANRLAYVCSSELHQRAIRPALWHRWAKADGVCTDFPHLLAGLEIDRKPELHPAGWHAEAHA